MSFANGKACAGRCDADVGAGHDLESAAKRNAAVTASRGRYASDNLTVELTVDQADALSDTLGDAQRRVAQDIESHQLPGVRVTVTLAGYDRRKGRELE